MRSFWRRVASEPSCISSRFSVLQRGSSSGWDPSGRSIAYVMVAGRYTPVNRASLIGGLRTALDLRVVCPGAEYVLDRRHAREKLLRDWERHPKRLPQGHRGHQGGGKVGVLGVLRGLDGQLVAELVTDAVGRVDGGGDTVAA